MDTIEMTIYYPSQKEQYSVFVPEESIAGAIACALDDIHVQTEILRSGGVDDE